VLSYPSALDGGAKFHVPALLSVKEASYLLGIGLGEGAWSRYRRCG
jgi:hypothetical protein